jgi:hypothetical protein
MVTSSMTLIGDTIQTLSDMVFFLMIIAVFCFAFAFYFHLTMRHADNIVGAQVSPPAHLRVARSSAD